MRSVVFAACAAIFATAGAAQERGAVVTHFNGHSVTIQARGLLGYVPDEIEELAQRMCASDDRDAEYQTGFNVSSSAVNYFFVCV